jgi:hypothetical protein
MAMDIAQAFDSVNRQKLFKFLDGKNQKRKIQTNCELYQKPLTN